MKNFISTLALAFALCLSPATKAEEPPVVGGSAEKLFQLDGSVAYSYFDPSHNKVPFSNFEFNVGASLRLTDRAYIYTAIQSTDTTADLSAAFLKYEIPTSYGVAYTYLGRIRNLYGIYNEKRTNPATRGSILLPQGVYWDVLYDLSRYSDGAAFGFKTPQGIDISAAYTKSVLKDQRVVNDMLLVPGSITTVPTWKWSATWDTASGFRIGYADAIWEFKSEAFEEVQTTRLKNAHIMYSGTNWDVAAEALSVTSSSTRAITNNASTGYSLSGSYIVLPNLKLKANVNTFDYNNPMIDMFAPNVAKTIDRNIGVDYKDISTPWTYRLEFHRISGTSWLAPKDNPGGAVKDWDLIAAQVIYEF